MDLPEEVVRRFFEEVRSGRNPDSAAELMADRVLAHQVTAEEPKTLERTPQDYAEHVREMKEAYGDFRLKLQELLVQEDRVYVRWQQMGAHVGEIDGFAPTGLPIVQLASAVYRVEAGKIAEYWIQIDQAGLRVQLEAHAK